MIPFFVFTFTFVTASQIAPGITGEFRRCLEPSSPCLRWWDPDWTPTGGGVPCPDGGRSCEYKEGTTIVGVISVTSIPGLGWNMTIPVGPIEFTNLDNSESVTISNLQGFVFVGDEYHFRILSWSENPSYEGVQVTLNGATVSAMNTIQVFIPL